MNQADIYLKDATELYEKGQLKDALTMAQKSAKLFKGVQNWKSYVMAQTLAAQMRMMLSSPEEGFAILQEILPLSLQYVGEVSWETSEIYERIGYYYGLNNRFEEAILVFQKKLKIDTQLFGEQHRAVANTYNYLSFCYRDQGYLSLALDFAQKALRIMLNEFGEKDGNVAFIHNNLGIIYIQKMDWDRALEYCNKALKIRIELLGGQHPFVADSYHYIGQAYHHKGEHQLGLLYFQKVLQIRQHIYGNEHRLCATAYSNMGSCYSLMKKSKEALSYFFKGLKIQEKAFNGKHTVIAKTFYIIAKEYENQGMLGKAIEYHRRALSLHVEILGKEHLDVVNTRRYLGECLLKSEQYDSAFRHLKKSLELSILLAGEEDIVPALSYKSLGNYFFKQKKHVKALQNFQTALTIFSNQSATKNLYQNPPIDGAKNLIWFLEILLKKAACLYDYALLQKGEFTICMEASFCSFQQASEAITRIRQNYKTIESKINLGRQHQHLYNGGVQAALALERPRDAFQFGEQAKANLLLSSMQDNWAKVSSNIPYELLQQEKELKIELTYLDKTIQKEAAKGTAKDTKLLRRLQAEFFDHHEGYTQLIEKFEQGYPNYYHLKYVTQTTTIEEIQERLTENQVMVSYFVGDSYYCIFLITPDLFEVFSYEKPNDFEALIEAFLQAIQHHQLEIYCRTAFQLHRLLMKEVEAFLIDPFAENSAFGEEEDSINNKQLIIIPHDILNYVPFEALICTNPDEFSLSSNPPTGWGKSSKNPYHQLDYLLLHCEISYHYSATLWHYLRTSRGERAAKDTGFVGFAPVYDSEAGSERSEAGGENQNLVPNRNLKEEIEGKWTAVAKELGQWATRSEALRGDGTWTPLPHSKTETQQIAALFAAKGLESKTFLHEQATKEQFREAAEKSRFLLIAAHGVVNDERPKLSGLVFYPTADGKTVDGGRKTVKGERNVRYNESLSTNNEPQNTNNQPLTTNHQHDCILSMEETYHLNLQADLVVLSSCESGIGQLAKGEGMMAVNRGFLFAGAKNVVSTLFKVYDKPSSLLTQFLFERILEGMDYAAALRQAKIDLLKVEKVDVKSWCGFVLIGGGA